MPSATLGTRKALRVKGTVNGHPISTTAMPWRDGTHVITINAETRRRMGLQGGERLEVTLEPDTAPADIAIPDDLAAALRDRPGALAAFEVLSPYQRKRYVSVVEEAKRPETRARRIAATVEKLLEGRESDRPEGASGE